MEQFYDVTKDDINELLLYRNNGFGFSSKPFYWRNYDGYDFRDKNGRYWLGDESLMFVIGDGIWSAPEVGGYAIRCIKNE